MPMVPIPWTPIPKTNGSTLLRPETGRRAGVVSEDGAELLSEAFRFTFSLRLRTQLAARRALGLPPPEEHHALHDALATAELFLALRERLGLQRLRQLT